MTTIAYKDGVMASDSLYTNGNDRRDYYMPKVHRLGRQGLLLGHAGGAPYAHTFKAWLHTDLKEGSPDLGGPRGAEMLIALPDGMLITVTHGGWEWYRAPFAAIGSGGDYAMGAMQAGASAEEAVRAAMALDTNTGGDVCVVRR